MAAPKRTVAHKATISELADLNRIDAFVRVMDAGSFTGAARALGMPKSSLSRAVAKLERELGVVLIQRTTRKLLITDAGQQYLSQARIALSVLADAQARLREEDGEPRGLVRLTAPLDPTGSMLAEPLVSFARRYPGITVEVLFTPRRLDLVADGVDLAVRAQRNKEDSNLVGRRFGSSPFVLVASPAYLEERGTPRRLSSLDEHDCLLFRGTRGTQRWDLTSKRGEESVQVRGPLSVDELSYLLHLARAGAGIALMPMELAHAGLLDGSLVRVLPSYSQEGASVYLVHPASSHLPRRVALLRDHLFAALQLHYGSCERAVARLKPA